jgi:hypothetical protein
VNGLLMGGSSLILSEFTDIIDIAKRVRAWTNDTWILCRSTVRIR